MKKRVLGEVVLFCSTLTSTLQDKINRQVKIYPIFTAHISYIKNVQQLSSTYSFALNNDFAN